MQNVGQTGRCLQKRFSEHEYNSRTKKVRNFLYNHFRKTGHEFKNVTVQPVEHLTFSNDVTKSFKAKARFMAELNWIRNLQSPFPLGLNDNIYQTGNISKDPSIDIFNILSIRKRKTRSHGKRKNGNVKRQSRKKLSISDLHSTHLSLGKHKMLSLLSSLSLTSLKEIDEQADKIILRTDPLIKTACLIQSYTQHVLHPHIDKLSEHQRFFLKIPFINKGIDFIDIQSIFKDKTVLESVPRYFKNIEPPIICYKYNKPVRNMIFNYNKIVADLNINDNMPETCECAASKHCYKPAGHIITGNFDLIKDKRLRNLLSKGPKYRLPSLIDFDSCRTKIAEAIQNFSIKWCNREHVEQDALNDWKKKIFEIVDKRISFYKSNTHLLPRKPTFSYRHLRKQLKDFHSNFVLVPADKASNNIIII